jgi:hypothetical protein
MKIRINGYSHTYPLGASGQFEKSWLEVDFEEGDDIIGNLIFLKNKIEQFHKESNPNGLTVTSVKVVDDNKSPEEKMVAQIYQITDVRVLESFKLLASKNEKIKSAYDNRLKQLTA